ncbi:MAG: TonB-dependent receptor [Phascolarctobacterium sp.]|nr:TonB-dependent receptor [Phascolarctobacterium sp.]
MKKMTKAMLMTALILGSVQWGGTAVHASETTLQEFTLDPMIVTAQRMEMRDLDTPAAVEVFTHEELVATGGNNLQEALKFGTGLMFQSQGVKGTSQGTMTSKIIIRGVEKGTLVLVDGVPMNQSGRYNLEDISVDLIERVEIVRGGGAVLYGSEATGGVVNIITKGTRTNKIRTAWGNFDGQNHAIDLQAGKLGFGYSYEKFGDVENMSDPAGGRPVGNYYNIERGEHNNFNMRYNFNENLYLTHNYNENNAHYVYAYKPQNGAVNKDVIHTIKQHVTQLHYNDEDIKAVMYYNDKDQNALTKARNSSKVNGNTVYKDTMKSVANAGYNDKSFGFDFQKQWDMKDDTLIMGASFQRDLCDYSEDSLTLSSGAYEVASREFERNMYSIYGQYSHALNNVSDIIFSARQTWTGQTKADGSTADDTSLNGENYHNFTPEIQYINRLSKNTSFYAKAGKSFMMPTFTQMFGSGNIIGNADLEPQEGTHYEIGLKKNIANQAWRLAIFNYEIDNSIESKWVADKGNDSWDVQYTNEDIKNTGIELSCDVDMGNGLTGNFGVSYSNPQKYSTTTEYGIETQGRWRDYYGKFQFNGGLNYQKDKWNTSLNFNYIGKRTRDVDAESSMKPYLFTNLNISYKPTKDSKFFLNIDNLLDRKDITTAATSSFYTMERNFMLGYEHSF